MKTYLLVLTLLLSILYLITALVIFDILWITKISEWTQSDRGLICLVIFVSCLATFGIKGIIEEH